MSGRVGAVVLAAGAGTRLGGVAKALLPAGGTTFLGAIARAAAAAGIAAGDVVVVVGAPYGDAVAAEAARLGLGVAWNPASARGMASSVAVGFAALDPALDAALLWPVDHPAVRPATVTALIAAQGATGARAVVPTRGGRGGHPALVARALWPALVACADAADGARGVLRAADPHRLAVDDPAVVRDVDTADDLAGSA
jgi:molybdenum cofactor cytidylyltransferase